MMPKLKIVVMLAAFLLAPLAPGWSQEGSDLRIYTETISRDQAWAEFLARWESFRSKLMAGDEPGARRDLQLVVESKWDGGVGDLPVYSVALIHLAGDKPGSAEWLLESAVKLSPGSAYVELCMARYYLGGGMIHLGEALQHYLSAWNKAPEDLSFRMRAVARLYVFPLVLALLVGVVLSVVVMVRYGSIYWHDFSDFFASAGLPRWSVAGLAALALLVPAAAGLSGWWLIAWWLVIFSLYMKPGEIILTLIWFALVFSAPVLLQNYARLEAAPGRADLQAELRVYNGLSLPGDAEILARSCPADPDSVKELVACFSRARLLSKLGRFDESLAVYNQLLDDSRVSQLSYLNRAEVLFFKPEPSGKSLEGALAKVEGTLKEAESKGPERMEVFYNWGRYHQFGDSTKMTKSLARAKDLDPGRMRGLEESYFEQTGTEDDNGRPITTRKYRFNRLFASARLPMGLLQADISRETEISRAVYQGLWVRWMGPMSEFEFWGALSGCVVIMVVLLIFKGRWRLSYRCSSCGRPICARCAPPGKDPAICSPCYYVFRDSASMVDLQVKMEKRAEAQHFKDLWDRGGLAASLLLPGSGLLVRGFVVSAIVVLAPALLILTGVLTDWAVWPMTWPSYHHGIYGHHAVLGLLWIVLMIGSLLAYRSRTD